MKMPIAWHEECLKNLHRSYQAKWREHEALFQQLARDRQTIAFYEHQIQSAKMDGRDGFDEKRFLRKRK